MSIPRLGPSARCTVLIATSILVAGCGQPRPLGPTVDQAGHDLSTQFYKLLFATPTEDIKVTDPLFDKYLPCGPGKVKLTYTVSGKRTPFAPPVETVGSSPATPGDVIDELVRRLPEVGTFTIAERDGQNDSVQVVNAKTHTRLTLRSPGKDELVISGETDCLRRGTTRTH
jgi:hypothetical protein